MNGTTGIAEKNTGLVGIFFENKLHAVYKLAESVDEFKWIQPQKRCDPFLFLFFEIYKTALAAAFVTALAFKLFKGKMRSGRVRRTGVGHESLADAC